MALSNYTELKASILEFLERSGDGKVTPQLNTIIPLAEAWINRRLGGYQREITVTLAADANGNIDLPTGFVGMRGVSASARPYRYAVGGRTLTVSNGANGTFDVVYLSRLAPLTDGNPSNWLLAEAPDAYLDACLMRASILLQDQDGATAYGSSAAASIDEFTRQNMVAQYANAALVIPVQVP